MVQRRAVAGSCAALVLALVTAGCSAGRTEDSLPGRPASGSATAPAAAPPASSAAPAGTAPPTTSPATARVTATPTATASRGTAASTVPSGPPTGTHGPTQPAPPPVAAGTPALRPRPVAGHGLVLTDSRGFTLYRYDGDAGGIACTGGCLTDWHPLLAAVGARPLPSSGLDPSLVGAEHRPDSGLQVSWRGAPLYTYAGDVRPGEVRGDGVGGTWHLVAAPGSPSRAGSHG